MNKEEYAEYEQRVEHSLKGLTAVSSGACPGCAECGLEDVDSMNCEEYEYAHEPSFSWSSCDCCGSNLGGDRYPAHGFWTDDKGRDHLCHLSVCQDCYYYLVYGQLDDMTMMEIED